MPPLTRVTESSGQLVVTYAGWFTVAVIVLTVVLFALAAVKRDDEKKFRSSFLGGLCLMVFAYYVVTYRILLSDDAGKVYAFLWHDDRIEWKSAVSARLIHGSARRGSSLYIWDRHGREFELPLKGINGPDREKVMAFVAARLPVQVTESAR